jgi:hypothetical protein
MKNIKKYQKAILTVIFLVVIGLLAWYINKYYIAAKVSTDGTKNSSTIPISTPITDNQETSDNIIYATIKDNVTEINKTDIKANKKTLFTDKDEEQKINKIGGYAYLSQEVLVVTGSAPIGKLKVIKTDGTGKSSTLIESFGVPRAITVSPDGKTIAFVTFSNVEVDYGYSIYTISRDGTNRRKIVTKEQEINYIALNKEADKISYVTTDSSGKSEIDTAEIDTGKNNSIYSSSDKILTLTWNQNNLISFTVATDALKAGQVWKISPDGSSALKLYESKDSLPIFSAMSTDTLEFSFLLNTYDKNIDTAKEGTLNSIKYSGGNINKITNANMILGWIP